MTDCNVLRCQEPPTTTGPLATTSEISASTTVPLCERHRAAIDSETVDWRWDFEDQHVLMDPDDLAGDHMWLKASGLVHLQGSNTLERSSKPDHTDVLHLQLRRWGSEEMEDFYLMLSREDLLHLRDSIAGFVESFNMP